MSQGNLRVIWAAMGANLLIAACKLFAAWQSRSSAMAAEAAHSLADTTNQIFLLWGLKQSRREADQKHPFGYGSETYFWAFIVALCIFTVGAGFSLHEGIDKIRHSNEPHAQLAHLGWAFGTLAVSIVLELISFFVAIGEFAAIKQGRTIRQTLTEARDPTVVTVLFEDAAALFGLVVALVGLLLAKWTGSVFWDGLASIIVGIALAIVAIVLAKSSKRLLIGQGVPAPIERAIFAQVSTEREVLQVIHLRTLHFAPEEVMLGIKIRFSEGLDTRQLEDRINEIEKSLRDKFPFLRRIYVEPGFDERAAQSGPVSKHG